MQNDGDICVCNKNTESFRDNKKDIIYIHKQGIEAAWNSYTRKMIAAGLDHGKRLPSCQSCWDDEDAGAVSKRQMDWKYIFEETVPNLDKLKVLMFGFGNSCNLACRTCGSYRSEEHTSELQSH